LLLDEDDNSGIGDNAAITRTLLANGTFYVRIKATSPKATGNYSINIVQEPYYQPPRDLRGKVALNVTDGQCIDQINKSIILNWSAPLTEISPLSYTVYIGNERDSTFSTSSTTETTYSCIVPIETTLWFYVKAVYSTGESTPTATISLSTNATILAVDGAAISNSLIGYDITWNFWHVETQWYKFYAPRLTSEDNKSFIISAIGGLDMSMYLYKGDTKTLIEKDEHSYPYFDAQLSIDRSKGEWYYISVTASRPGTYTIGINTFHDIPYKKIIVDAPPFYESYDSTLKTIEYRFTTGVAGIYTIQTYGKINTLLNLYDSIGFIEQNDDGGTEANALIERNLNANTLYIVRMTATSAGDYSISVNAPIMSLVALDPCYSSSIVYCTEEDWYKFQTGEAGDYKVEQSIASWLMISLFESDQTTIIASDAAEESVSSQMIEHTLSANTWYYIKIINNQWRAPIIVNTPYCISIKAPPSITTLPAFDRIKENIFIYPNPTKDVINISLNNSCENRLILTIYNMEGQAVKKIPVESGINQNRVDLSDIQTGVYLLELRDSINGMRLNYSKIIKY
jgi:hypothetical protein